MSQNKYLYFRTLHLLPVGLWSSHDKKEKKSNENEQVGLTPSLYDFGPLKTNDPQFTNQILPYIIKIAFLCFFPWQRSICTDNVQRDA